MAQQLVMAIRLMNFKYSYIETMPNHSYLSREKQGRGSVMNDGSLDKCPRCNRECIFKWKVFSNGTHHIAQNCPIHGYLKYVPKIEPYVSSANANQKKDNAIQKKLF
jgi:hypothetical protein